MLITLRSYRVTGLRASWLYGLFFYLLAEILGFNARAFAIYSFIFSISACKLNEKIKSIKRTCLLYTTICSVKKTVHIPRGEARPLPLIFRSN